MGEDERQSNVSKETASVSEDALYPINERDELK